MLLPVPPEFRRHRGQLKPSRVAPTPPPPSAPLVLVAAVYDESAAQVVLTFDRAVNIDGFSGGQVTLVDGTFNSLSYEGGDPAVLDGPVMVQITLGQTGEWLEAGVKLWASSLNGIVAVDDGGAWEGVADLELPFG